jgi:hypothetical protein
MVKINSSEVIQRVIDGLKVESAVGTPQEITDKIVPVYVANERGRLHVFQTTTVPSVALRVPAGKIWKVLWGHVSITNTATVGNRQYLFNIVGTALTPTSTVNTSFWVAADTSVMAASTSRTINLHTGSTDSSATASRVFIPLPSRCVLYEGMGIQMVDSNNVDPADSVSFRMVVIEQSMEGEIPY